MASSLKKISTLQSHNTTTETNTQRKKNSSSEIHLNSKYPEISCVEERDKYRAVFNDQYQEYKDLHSDVSATLSKFTQLDAAMARLLREGKTQEVRWMFQHYVHIEGVTDTFMYRPARTCYRWFTPYLSKIMRVTFCLSGSAEDKKRFEEV